MDLRIATYNILNPYHAVKWKTPEGIDAQTGRSNWDERKSRVARQLAGAAFDLCALQEVSPANFQWLAEEAWGFSSLWSAVPPGPSVPSSDKGKEGAHGCVILYKPSRLELIVSENGSTQEANYITALFSAPSSPPMSSSAPPSSSSACASSTCSSCGRGGAQLGRGNDKYVYPQLVSMTSVHLPGYDPSHTTNANPEVRARSKQRGLDHLKLLVQPTWDWTVPSRRLLRQHLKDMHNGKGAVPSKDKDLMYEHIEIVAGDFNEDADEMERWGNAHSRHHWMQSMGYRALTPPTNNKEKEKTDDADVDLPASHSRWGVTTEFRTGRQIDWIYVREQLLKVTDSSFVEDCTSKYDPSASDHACLVVAL